MKFSQNLAKKNDEQKLLFWFVILCIALTIFRITWLYITELPLYGDEAQYWGWAQDLNFGYYSKPPVIAWLIWLSTSLFGDVEASIRLSSSVLHLGTTYMVYKITLLFYKENTALWTAFAYITMPAVFLSSLLISTDAPLMFLWSLSLYFYLKAARDNKLFDWAMLGVVAGIGLLTKYSMAIFALSVFVHIAMSKNWGMLRNKNLWIATSIAAFLFLPNLIWNFLNDFPSMSHTYDLAQGRSDERFSMKNGFGFFFAQFGMIGPFLFAAIMCGFKEDRKIDVLKIFTFVFLGIIVLLSFYSRAHANWAAPAYISGTILAVVVLANSKYRDLIKTSIALHAFIGLSAMMYLVFDDLKDKNTPLGRLYSPHQLVQEYKAGYYADDHKILVFDDRMMLSVFKYYMRDRDMKFVKWNPGGATKDHFDLTTNLNDHARSDLVILSGWLTTSILDDYAKEVKELGEISSSEKYGKRTRSLKVFKIEDFHGY